MKIYSVMPIVLVASLLFGCAAPRRQIALTNSFNAADVAWAKGTGTGKIIGSAVIQTVGGVPRNCAGRVVDLFPVSMYSSERFGNIYGNTNKGYINGVGPLMEQNADYLATSRKATCDAQGAFEFDELPDGEYFLTTIVAWQATQYRTEGGALMLRVKSESGKTKKVVLAP
jgi:hypothetical protein